MVPLVKGSTWQISSGSWVLTGCPAGYYLYPPDTASQICQLCPASYYCTGGALTSTSCTSDQYSLPMSTSEADCFAAVFVGVVVNVPISDPDFKGQTELLFQDAIARAADRRPDFVTVDNIQPGNNNGTTTVTSRVATFDAKEAAILFQGLNASTVQSAFASVGLGSPTLISVQVTACVPGYELVTSQSNFQICLPCPSNYFCSGGSNGRQSCPAGSFSAPGANASSFCNPVVFVVVATTLPISPNNFTSNLQSKFQAAMAATAGVPLERVVVTGETESRRSADPQLLVNSEIAAENAAAALSISQHLDLKTLNSNLQLQGLPACSSLSVTVPDANVQQASGTYSLSSVLGGSVCGVVLVVAGAVAGYFLSKRLMRQWAHNAFLAAMSASKAGQEASAQHLPPDDGKKSLSLRMHYTAEEVLGKGTSGGFVVRSVQKSTRKSKSEEHDCDSFKKTAEPVAIKIVVPSKGTFDEAEKHALKREAVLLQLVTRKQCKAAVQTVESDGVEMPQRANVGWFIMEALGPSVAAERPAGDAACIQVARDVLAALKVLHDEGWVHCDVTPANIVRCAARKDKDGFEFKLIDFGSALRADDACEDGIVQAATGEPAYRAPEMFRQPCVVTAAADIWSLGVTMFDLQVVSGRLPATSPAGDLSLHWAALWAAAVEARSSEACGCPAVLDEGSGSVDQNLAKVIATARKKERSDRRADQRSARPARKKTALSCGTAAASYPLGQGSIRLTIAFAGIFDEYSYFDD